VAPDDPEKQCPNCGADVAGDERVCSTCRYDFVTRQAPGDPRDPHGEPLNPGG
jgi:predicted amidophosphoribosyltransferase